MAWKLLALMMIAALLLAGCAPAAAPPVSRSSVYPGTDWAWANSPESMGWSSAKLATAQAYAKHISSAAVMVVDDGVVIAA